MLEQLAACHVVQLLVELQAILKWQRYVQMHLLSRGKLAALFNLTMLARKPIQSFLHTTWFDWHTAAFVLRCIMRLRAGCLLEFKVPQYPRISLDSIFSSRDLSADSDVCLQEFQLIQRMVATGVDGQRGTSNLGDCNTFESLPVPRTC